MRKRHVTPRLAALLAALALAGALAVVAGCESKPAAPAFDNPFDPGGPTDGDGLQVTAAQADTVIYVFWNQPQDMGIVEYIISHTTDLGGEWAAIDTSAQTAQDRGFYAYAYKEPSVLALLPGGGVHRDQQQPHQLLPGRVRGGSAPDGAGHRRPPAAQPLPGPRGYRQPGRHPRAGGRRYFQNPRRLPVDALGVPQTVPWDLGPGHYGAVDSVFLRVFGPGNSVTNRVKLDLHRRVRCPASICRASRRPSPAAASTWWCPPKA